MSEIKPRFGLMPIPYNSSYFSMLQKGELMLDKNTADIYTKNDSGNIISKTYDLGVDVEKIKTILYSSTNQLCFSGSELYKLNMTRDSSDTSEDRGFPFLKINHGASVDIDLYKYFFKISHYDKIVVKVRFALLCNVYFGSNDSIIERLYDYFGNSKKFIKIKINDISGADNCKIISKRTYNSPANSTFIKNLRIGEMQSEFVIKTPDPINCYDEGIFYSGLTQYSPEDNYVKINIEDISSILGTNYNIFLTDIDIYKENDIVSNDIKLPLIIDSGYIYRHSGYIDINKTNETPHIIIDEDLPVLDYNKLFYDITMYPHKIGLLCGIYSITFNISHISKYIYIYLYSKNDSTVKKLTIDTDNAKRFKNPSGDNNLSVITTSFHLDYSTYKIEIEFINEHYEKTYSSLYSIKIDQITTASFDDCDLITLDDMYL